MTERRVVVERRAPGWRGRALAAASLAVVALGAAGPALAHGRWGGPPGVVVVGWRFDHGRGWRFEHRPGVWSPHYVWWWVGGRVVFLPAPTVTVVQYATGRWELRGDGVTVPYYWVWIPAAVVVAPPPPPVAPPPPPPAAPPPPPPAAPPAPPPPPAG